jgi:flagellar biosynthesis GTPase FlhF
MNEINPRATIGDNRPTDATESLLGRLGDDYGELTRSASSLLETARSLGETVENERELEGFSNVIVAMRDAIARAEAARTAEKEPYLRGGQAVDGFFSSLKERLDKGRTVLQRRVDVYQNRKLAEERERRRLAAEQAVREQRERDAEAARLAREAEEKRLAAERARKPETKEAKVASASAAEGEAAAAAAAASVASDAAETARIDTLRKPSEIARSRFDEGRLVTMRQVGFAELVDRERVDMNALRPYFTEQEIAKALRGWAKATGHKKPMDGAEIGLRDEAVVR